MFGKKKIKTNFIFKRQRVFIRYLSYVQWFCLCECVLKINYIKYEEFVRIFNS